MTGLHLRTKLNLLILIPAVMISGINSYFLFLASAPILQLANLFVLFIVILSSVYFIDKFAKKFERNLKDINEGMEGVQFCGKLLQQEIKKSPIPDMQTAVEFVAIQTKVIDGLYSELKSLLKLSLAGSSLAQSKELARICREMGAVNQEIKGCTDLGLAAALALEEQRETKLLLTDNLIKGCQRFNKKFFPRSEVENFQNIVEFTLKNPTLRKAIRIAEEKGHQVDATKKASAFPAFRPSERLAK